MHRDGVDPNGGLLMDKTGTLFGTTAGGGTDTCGGYGCGTVFEIERQARAVVPVRLPARQLSVGSYKAGRNGFGTTLTHFVPVFPI